MRTLTKDIVARVAYMIGVKDEHLESYYNEYCADTLQETQNSKEARIIRILNRIRTTMIQKYDYIDKAIRYELKNLNTIEYFNPDDIQWLEEQGIQLLQVNINLDKYFIKINQLINENILNCKHLIPEWVSWEYIKDLFIVPGSGSSNEESALRILTNERKKYYANRYNYPFQIFIHWQPAEYGNILNSDKKFLSLLYQFHNKIFDDNSKVLDANSDVKDNIYDFINDNDRTAIIVDCENSDVYKLYAVLKNLNKDDIQKVEKIILYDDCHTINTWKLLSNLVNIPVEYVEVERVKGDKSLVDIKMTAGICREFYENHIPAFILVSSDSDFWGAISSLPTANFLVMIEYEKCGADIKQMLQSHNIFYCSIDDFCSGNIGDIKLIALKERLTQTLADFNSSGIWRELDADKFIDNIYETCGIEPNEAERKRFIDKYLKTLKFGINKENKFYIHSEQINL